MSTIRITALPAASAVTSDDLIPIEDSPSGTAVTQKATAAQVATTVRAVAGAYQTDIINGDSSAITLNTASANINTRIAGTTDANTVFVKASTDKVGLGTASPTQKLDVSGTAKATAWQGNGSALTNLTGTAQLFQSLSSDPGAPTVGDVWYNTTSKVFKGYRTISAFAASSSISTGRNRHAGAGTTSATVIFGGVTTGVSVIATSEAWNGSAWSSGGTMGSTRHSAGGCGTSTAALAAAGFTVVGSPYTNASPNSEKYNGSSWSSTGSQTTGHSSGGIFGTQTSALAFSGYPGGGSYTATSESFNGSTWASSTNYPFAEEGVWSNAGASSSSGVSAGDYNRVAMYAFNGTTWSSAGNRANAYGWGQGAGTASAAIGCGGTTSGAAGGATANTEVYNGTSWSAGNSLGTARFGPAGGANSSTQVLVTGGGNATTTYLTTTEISGSNAIQTFTQA
jgi:hypothetical protein